MGENRRPVTIFDVANAAGVSVSTVSRVLNKKDDVALETCQKVQAIIDELGYSSSLAARGMRSRHTNVIGLIMPDLASPYAVEILRGINREIARSDYDLLVYTTGDIRKYSVADQERHYVRLLNGSITDGLIVVTPAAITFPSNAPLVAIDPNTENPDFPGIIATNCEGALEVVTYLTKLCHRRIGFITGRLDLVSGNRRLAGYKQGLAAAGIPFAEELVQIGDYTTETAVECTRALLALGNPPTAIFASNDMSAMGVYQAAKEVGLGIPDDLSVVGFDNTRESVFLDPPLTTVDQFISEMSARATEVVMKMIKGEIPEDKLIIIPTQLVVRESCQAIF